MGWLFYFTWMIWVIGLTLGNDNFNDAKIWSTFWGLIGGTLIHAIITITIMVYVDMGHCTNTEEWNIIEYGETEELLQISTSNQIEGSMFLGCGSIDGVMVYTYYTKAKNSDAYILKTIKTEKCRIFETNNITPCIKHINYLVNPNYKPSKFVRAYFGKKAINFRKGSIIRSPMADIFIPKNTIVTNFSGINLDK